MNAVSRCIATTVSAVVVWGFIGGYYTTNVKRGAAAGAVIGLMFAELEQAPPLAAIECVVGSTTLVALAFSTLLVEKEY